MADLPGSIGHLTVTGRGVLALADSNDVGEAPDQVTALATITFTPNLSGVDVLTSVADDMFIFPQTIKCTLNSDGRLVPPSDGVSADPDPGAPTEVQLIAPQQNSLNYTGWTWTAKFAPVAPQNWQTFQRSFTGAPGDDISLAQVITQNPVPGVLQALVYPVATTAEPFPNGYRVGVDLLLTPDNKLWRTTP
ncbi:hypothetical protein ASE16_03460 [Leifsonia sp. Root227]|uniref:hypothetical protein n=1 Tax=Leifsonia sp. Root227 TaxID=1736496 RepID=UPI0006F74E34|nr:hypothetical protein [Leifsonia sp. Root227]KRC52118.1 hypothetical protein ASE16_03460 [Leifsonia sp. Root227]